MSDAAPEGMRALSLITVTACTTTLPPAFREWDHLDRARDHAEIARERGSWPDVREVDPSHNPFENQPILPYYVDTQPEHITMEDYHLGRAAEMEKDYSEACGDRDPAQILTSPLTTYRLGGWNIENGVVVILGPQAGTPEKVLSDLYCHQAWMLIDLGPDLESPLLVPGLEIATSGDRNGTTVSLTVQANEMVPELQRRVARQMEQEMPRGQAMR